MRWRLSPDARDNLKLWVAFLFAVPVLLMVLWGVAGFFLGF